MTNEQLIKKALSVINRKIFGDSEMGGVGCALLSGGNNIYLGVCIDTSCGMGFCAEPNAISSMITAGEYKIEKIVAVYRDAQGKNFVLPPCGRCREFMRQINSENLDAEVILGSDKTLRLKELLPFHDWLSEII